MHTRLPAAPPPHHTLPALHRTASWVPPRCTPAPCALALLPLPLTQQAAAMWATAMATPTATATSPPRGIIPPRGPCRRASSHRTEWAVAVGCATQPQRARQGRGGGGNVRACRRASSPRTAAGLRSVCVPRQAAGETTEPQRLVRYNKNGCNEIACADFVIFGAFYAPHWAPAPSRAHARGACVEGGGGCQREAVAGGTRGALALVHCQTHQPPLFGSPRGVSV